MVEAADFFAEKRLGIYEPKKHTEKIKHIEAVLEMLKVFTKDNRYGEIKETIIKSNRERSDSMCEFLDEYLKKGLEEGKITFLVKLVIKEKISIDDALEEVDISRDEFERKIKEFSLL